MLDNAVTTGGITQNKGASFTLVSSVIRFEKSSINDWEKVTRI